MKYGRCLDATLIAVIAFYLMVAPYIDMKKESFNMQAIHDIIDYGIFPRSTIVENYDHVQFPGVTPQTFVGSLVLAGIFKGLNFIMALVGYDFMDPKNVLLVVRSILGLLNALLLIKLKDSVKKVTLNKKLRGSIGFWLIFLLLHKFDLLSFCSRTSPEYIALPVVLMGISKIVEGDISGLFWLSFIGIVFRLEVGLLGGLIALLSSLRYKQSKIRTNIIMLVSGTILGLLATVVVDSYFWGRLIVPELESFLFSIVEGNSVEWGAKPWYAYFQPFFLELLLVIPGYELDPAYDGSNLEEAVYHPARHSLSILLEATLFYSIVRSFNDDNLIETNIFVEPVNTLLAATGLAYISTFRHSNFIAKFMRISVMLSAIAFTLLVAATSLVTSYISSYNYPGADALSYVNSQLLPHQVITVHMDAASCEAGIHKFDQLNNGFVNYVKTESETELLKMLDDIDILISATDMTDFIEELNAKNEEIDTEDSFWLDMGVFGKFSEFSLDEVILFLFSRVKHKTVFLNANLQQSWYQSMKARFAFILGLLRSPIVTKDCIYVYEKVRLGLRNDIKLD